MLIHFNDYQGKAQLGNGDLLALDRGGFRHVVSPLLCRGFLTRRGVVSVVNWPGHSGYCLRSAAGVRRPQGSLVRPDCRY